LRALVTTHHLELTSPGGAEGGTPAGRSYELVRVEIPSPELNRFLYVTVGADWCWYERLAWSRARWLEWLDRPEVGTWVAYVRGAPAGYFELERQQGGSVEICYFGLLPDFIGRGLGAALLTDAVAKAWSFGARGLGARRVWLHTCSLDHPAALANYRARGFRLFRTDEGHVELPDEPLDPWSAAGRF